jgi:hypothetical protein
MVTGGHKKRLFCVLLFCSATGMQKKIVNVVCSGLGINTVDSG